MSSRKRRPDADYLALTAVIRARESRLPDPEALERMSGLGESEVFWLEEELGFADMTKVSRDEIESALAGRLKRELDELSAVAPDRRLVDAFRLKYDYHNAKTIIKARALGVCRDELLSACGRFSPDAIAEAFHEEKPFHEKKTHNIKNCAGELTELFAKALTAARDVLTCEGDPRAADFILDRAYFAELTDISQKTRSEFLYRWARLLIDSANVSSAARAARGGACGKTLRDSFIEGGEINFSRISGVSDEELEKLAESAEAAAQGWVKRGRRQGFGDGALIAYLAGLENEIAAARAIHSARLSGLDSAVLRKRLRAVYANYIR